MELPPVLSGMEDILVLGVWPPTTLFCKLGEVPELDDPTLSVFGG